LDTAKVIGAVAASRVERCLGLYWFLPGPHHGNSGEEQAGHRGTRVFLERGQKPLDTSGSMLTATMWRPSGRMVAIVASVAFFLKIAIALRTYGTNDVFAYERFLHWSRYLGVGLYRAAWDFNHPPFMLHVLRGMGWLAQTSGVAFPFWLRLPGIVADPITLWLVWKTLGPRTQEPTIC